MVEAAGCFDDYTVFRDIIEDLMDDSILLTDEDVVNEVFHQYADADGMYYQNFEGLLTALDYDYKPKFCEFDPREKSLIYYINGYGDDYNWMLDIFAIFYHDEPGKYKVEINNRNTGTGVKGIIKVFSTGYHEDNLKYY